MEGSRRGLGPTWGTAQVFGWKDWGRPRKTSIRVAGLRVEIAAPVVWDVTIITNEAVEGSGCDLF
jgi:hypothetical protein